MLKKVILTGISGQCGSFLADILIKKGYEVHGIIRRSSSFNTARIEHLYNNEKIRDKQLFLHYGDMTDGSSIDRLVIKIQPDEIYNAAAMSHVRVSFDIPEYTSNTTDTGALRLFESVRHFAPRCRVFQFSSSEMFGSTPPPQNEQSVFAPQSPYAVAKLAAYWNAVNYRTGYDLFISNGIIFNNESERRGETFVTKKITKAVANIFAKKQDKLFLGNLDAKRDWGYSLDYMYAAHLILQHDRPDDFVIATGEIHSVREFVEKSFSLVDLDWEKYVEIDSKYFRPNEVEALQGDASKIRKVLGWEPKVKFDELVKIMLLHDIKNTGLEPPKSLIN